MELDISIILNKFLDILTTSKEVKNVKKFTNLLGEEVIIFSDFEDNEYLIDIENIFFNGGNNE